MTKFSHIDCGVKVPKHAAKNHASFLNLCNTYFISSEKKVCISINYADE